MVVIELLTLAGVLLKLMGAITVSWFWVLMPEYVTIIVYIDWILLQFWRFCRQRRKRRRT